MALLKKLFGRGEPAPELQIHPDDQDLVSDADRRWWSTLTLKHCKVMEEQDNLWKATAMGYYMEQEGMSEEHAGRRMRNSFASYYAYLNERSDERLGFVGDDAKLPYMIKDRINRYITSLDETRVVRPGDVGLSTVNALIRKLIREGTI